MFRSDCDTILAALIQISESACQQRDFMAANEAMKTALTLAVHWHVVEVADSNKKPENPFQGIAGVEGV